MSIAGIIAEYNPFHEGHKYHIEETKRLTGADQVIVVMSGDFVQRGEPAILDKYIRAKEALENGADVILEMPAIYATASAEYFATAGVGILDAIGCVDYLSFGSEWADVEQLSALADILVEEPPLYKEVLKKYLEEGLNFPQAREKAVTACYPNEKYAAIMKSPNHILAIEYMKALRRIQSKIQPVAIRRKGSGYHDTTWNGEKDFYPSATAIRSVLQNISKGKEDMAQETVKILEAACPGSAKEIAEYMKNNNTVSWSDLMSYLDYMVLMKRKVLGKYFGMDYDLSRRIVKMWQPGKRLEENIATCHSKNYTDAALRRIFLHIVLNMKYYPFLDKASDIPIPYARVLGFRKQSGKILSRIRECGNIPMIQKTVDGRKLEETDIVAYTLFDMDVRCADFYEQIASVKSGRAAKTEWIRTPVIVS